MSQFEILDFLRKNTGQWYSAKDLVHVIGQDETLIRVKIKKLAKLKLIQCKKRREVLDTKRITTLGKKLEYKQCSYQMVFKA